MKVEGGLLTEEFLNRLRHAACDGFGTVTVVVRGAIEHALRNATPDGMVTGKHFALAYRSMSGCEASFNVFTAEKWHLIDVRKALFPDTDEPPQFDPSASVRGKRREL